VVAFFYEAVENGLGVLMISYTASKQLYGRHELVRLRRMPPGLKKPKLGVARFMIVVRRISDTISPVLTLRLASFD